MNENPLEGKSFKEVLALIDEWADTTTALNRGRMWDVLTALRGPDNDKEDVKLGTTAVVRRESLPLLARHRGAFVALPHEKFDHSLTYAGGSHFGLHTRDAGWALGLTASNE